MRIRITDKDISASGHTDRVRCGQLSVLCVSTVDYLSSVLNETPRYELSSGSFYLDKLSIRSNYGRVVVEYFEHSLRRLCEQLPECFTLDATEL